MKIFDLLGMCLRNLTRRKFRTFLTVFGVVIGTCSIVLMFSVGIGLQVSQEEYLSSIGDLTVITVYSRGNTQDLLLDDTAVATFQSLPGVTVATPFMELYNSLKDGSPNLYAGKKKNFATWTTVYGVYPEALEALGFEMAEGQMFAVGNGKQFQMIFGPLTAYNFYTQKNGNMRYEWPDENGNIQDPFFDPMVTDFVMTLSYWGSSPTKYTDYAGSVVGILEAGENDWEKNYAAYMHIDDMKYFVEQYNKEHKIKKDRDTVEQYNEVRVKVDNVKNVGAVQQAIRDMGYQAHSLEDWRQQLEESAQQIQSFLVILGAVSLFVAAISITNTMIMSVYERTREIGVMKVLGCLVSNIRVMFLVEAGLIGFIGGVAGVGVSYLLSYLLNTFGGRMGEMFSSFMMGEGSRISIIPPWLVGVGLVTATVIGLVSGFQPANRAVKISALEAIKTE